MMACHHRNKEFPAVFLDSHDAWTRHVPTKALHNFYKLFGNPFLRHPQPLKHTKKPDMWNLYFAQALAKPRSLPYICILEGGSIHLRWGRFSYLGRRITWLNPPTSSQLCRNQVIFEDTWTNMYNFCPKQTCWWEIFPKHETHWEPICKYSTETWNGQPH